MTQHNELFAIKLLIKGLNFSDTTINPIIKLIDELIENETNICSYEWAKELRKLNKIIDESL